MNTMIDSNRLISGENASSITFAEMGMLLAGSRRRSVGLLALWLGGSGARRWPLAPAPALSRVAPARP